MYFEFERWLAPHGNHSAGGYGILFVDAHDLARILRFVPTEAYPKSAAISSADHLIVAQEGKTVLTHAVNDDIEPPQFSDESPQVFCC